MMEMNEVAVILWLIPVILQIGIPLLTLFVWLLAKPLFKIFTREKQAMLKPLPA